MGRAGITIFALWGLTALLLGLPMSGAPGAILGIGLCALALTWWTRAWPEGLGLATGGSAALVVAGAVRGEAFAFFAAVFCSPRRCSS